MIDEIPEIPRNLLPDNLDLAPSHSDPVAKHSVALYDEQNVREGLFPLG